MDHNKLLEIITVTMVGGIVTLMIFPAMSYLLLSNIYRRKIIIRPGPPVKGTLQDYWSFPISVTNNSHTTLRQVIAFITIDYDPADVRDDPGSSIYNMFPPGHPLTISWSGNADDEIKTSLDLGKGATAVLPVFRRYQLDGNGHLLQVASGNGLNYKDSGTLLLNGAKEYEFSITVIADDIVPAIEHYKFNLHRADILEMQDGARQSPALALGS